MLQLTFGVSMTEQLHLKIVHQKTAEDEELNKAISENVLVRIVNLESSQYYDYEKKQTVEAGLSNYEISSIVALRNTEVFRIRHSDYAKFQNNATKDLELISNLIIEKLPGMQYCVNSRKRHIIEQFKEIVSTLFVLIKNSDMCCRNLSRTLC